MTERPELPRDELERALTPSQWDCPARPSVAAVLSIETSHLCSREPHVPPELLGGTAEAREDVEGPLRFTPA
jgi:hypothetical protein